MPTDKEKLAALERKVAALEAAQPAKAKSREELDAECRAWQDEVHKMRERQMSQVPVSPELLRAYEAACPPGTAQDLRAHGTVQSPSQAGASGQVTKASTAPGIPGSGWQKPVPLGPQPGINYVDAICVADDVRQRKGKG
jgi:hypothetical protein